MALVANPAASGIFSRLGQYEVTNRSIRALSETLRRIGVEEIPHSLKLELCDEDLPRTDLESVPDGGDQFPLIDFSLFHTDRRKLVKQLGDAARHWGTCQIINHGITLESMQQLVAESYKFFELPAERKQQTAAFVGDNTTHKITSLYWAESWMIHGTGPRADVDAKVLSAWPEGNSAFRNLVADYFDGVQRLTKKILEVYAEDLELESTDFYSKHLDTSNLTIRWNYYPECPQPSTVLGAKSHTDANMFTILLQDKVGGLQVEKDGRWFDVKPVDGALIVNISDGLHVWTNGRYKTVLHRVLANRNSSRISLSGIWSPDYRLQYIAPGELVDENHPRLYKPFKAGEYIESLFHSRTAISQTEHTKLLKGPEQLNKWKIRP